MDKLRKDVDRIDGVSKKLSRTLGGVGKAIAGAFTIGSVAAFTTAVVRASAQQEQALAQLQAAVKSTGGVAGFTADELSGMASEFQRLTTFGDEAVMSMQSVLLTFTQVRGPIFKDASQAILDVATRLNIDLKSAALQVGKALNDPVAGLGSLSRAGIQFTADQKALIKSLVETGQVAEAQRIILKELETQFGGSAAAARNTLGGALAALKNAAGDLLEVSPGATSGVGDLTGAVNDLTDLLSRPEVRDGIQSLAGGLLGIASAAVEAAAKLGEFITKVDTAFRADVLRDLETFQRKLAEGPSVLDRITGLNEEQLRENIRRLQSILRTEFPQGVTAAGLVAGDTVSGPRNARRGVLDAAAAAELEAAASAASAASAAAQVSAQQQRVDRDSGASLLAGDTFGYWRGAVEAATEAAEQEIVIATDRADRLLEQEQRVADFRVSAADRVTEAIFGASQAQIAIEEAKTQTFASLAQQGAAAGLLAGGKVAKWAKAYAVADVVWSTSRAIMKAWADVPWPANIAQAAKIAAAGAIQLAKIKATNPGISASIATGGYGSAAGDVSAVPSVVGEGQIQPRAQAQIIVQGHIFSTRETGEWFVNYIREQINDSDVTIIGPTSRQAFELAGTPA